MSQIIKSFNEQDIRIREKDNYVNLTDMANATGKRVSDWNRLEGTKSYLEVLSAAMQIPVGDLLYVNPGQKEGTWGHPKVAIRFAQWCSDEFAVQVDTWIEELMTKGRVGLISEKPMSAIELVQSQLATLTQIVAISVEHEKQLNLLKEKTDKQDAEILFLRQENNELQFNLETVEMEVVANSVELERFRNGHGYYYTIAAYCNKLKLKPSLSWMTAQGRRASAKCKEYNIAPQKINDPRYGEVNSYPDSILDQLNWDI